MSESPKTAPTTSKMEKIVALCKRRGFIFQSSEIYGGINGFWDYGPLGTELKKNLKDAWYHDIVRCPRMAPDGQQVEMVPLDCTIIMNPKVWVASGHVGGFNDPMVDCRETKARYRADHLACMCERGDTKGVIYAFLEGDDESRNSARRKLEKDKKKLLADTEIDF